MTVIDPGLIYCLQLFSVPFQLGLACAVQRIWRFAKNSWKKKSANGWLLKKKSANGWLLKKKKSANGWLLKKKVSKWLTSEKSQPKNSLPSSVLPGARVRYVREGFTLRQNSSKTTEKASRQWDELCHQIQDTYALSTSTKLDNQTLLLVFSGSVQLRRP